MAFFVCENRFPQYFWKPEFQTHNNAAQAIAAVYIAADDPDAHVEFLSHLTGGGAERIDGGQRISCGAQELLLLTPTRIRALAPECQLEPGAAPLFVGIAINSSAVEPHVVPAADACGIFIEWRRP